MARSIICNRHLLKGRYYWHRDGSSLGFHPSYIYKKNDRKNRYHIVCFTSSYGKRRRKLNRNINPNSNKDCYVLISPQIVRRKSLGDELVGYKVTDYRDKGIIKYIADKKK